MNTGIGDAVNLSWKLAAVLRSGAAASLLDTFEPERIAFARRLVQTTDRVFVFVTDKSPIAWRLRTRLIPLVARPATSPAGGAPVLVPHGFADRRQLSLEHAQRGHGWSHSRWRSPPLVPDLRTRRQFCLARVTRVASARLRRAQAGAG